MTTLRTAVAGGVNAAMDDRHRAYVEMKWVVDDRQLNEMRNSWRRNGWHHPQIRGW
jgi:hypothetical protein